MSIAVFINLFPFWFYHCLVFLFFPALLVRCDRWTLSETIQTDTCARISSLLQCANVFFPSLRLIFFLSPPRHVSNQLFQCPWSHVYPVLIVHHHSTTECISHSFSLSIPSPWQSNASQTIIKTVKYFIYSLPSPVSRLRSSSIYIVCLSTFVYVYTSHPFAGQMPNVCLRCCSFSVHFWPSHSLLASTLLILQC